MFDYTRCNNTQLFSFFCFIYLAPNDVVWQNRGKGVICLIKREEVGLRMQSKIKKS